MQHKASGIFINIFLSARICICSFAIMSIIISGKNAFAQIVNEGQLVVLNQLYINGDLINKGEITAEGEDGTLHISGDLINNSTSELRFDQHNIDVVLIGQESSEINGSNDLVFKNLEIRKESSAKIVTLNRNITVKGSLKTTTGKIDLQNYNIALGNTGYLHGESNDNRIFVSDKGHSGKIIATRTIDSPGLNENIAGLGIDVDSETFIGERTIIRGHKVQIGMENESVQKYYELPGFGELDSNNKIRIRYFEGELNNHFPGTLIIYQLAEYDTDTSIWAATNTIDNEGVCDVEQGEYGYYQFNLGGFYDLSSGIFTMGSEAKPLPIELLSFDVFCSNEGYQVEWVTASEINNNYFSIELSHDAQNFNTVAFVSSYGTGNSSYTQHYSYTLERNNETAVYLRLTQTDFDGTRTEFSPKYIDCPTILNDDEIMIFTSDNKTVDIVIKSLITSHYNIRIYSSTSGRQVYSGSIITNGGSITHSVRMDEGSNAIYIVHVFNSNSSKTEKILIIK